MPRQYTIKREESARFKIDYQSKLDPQQYAVVTSSGGPTLVIAGAGSGKTRTVTYRVARLIEQGVGPERILLLTFTNRAAREMLQRIDGVIETDVRRVWGGTFHAIGNRILRRHADVLGYTQSFSILDAEDAKDVIDNAIEAAGVNTKERLFPSSGVLQEMFSLAINKCVSMEELLRSTAPHLVPVEDPIEKVFEQFSARKRKANTMDYDDLLLNWKLLLEEHDEIRQYWGQQFEHILVDEFQDTNKLQSDVIDLLAGVHKNIMVVGDDAQSIYAWRGANFANIYNFKERYENATVFKIERNYRSRPEILQVANASIACNVKQFSKTLTAARPSANEKPGLVPLQDVDQQAAFVASRILELRDGGVPLSEIAVLYRSHWHCLEMQLELTRRGIPYNIRSGVRFFEQAHIKDIVSFLRIVVNARDEVAWKRLLKIVPGIGRATAMRIWERIAASDDPIAMMERPDFSTRPKSKDAWARFVELLKQLNASAVKDRPALQIELVMNSFYRDHLLNAYENANSRAEDLTQLANYAGRYQSTQEFLSELSLIASERFSPPDSAAGEDAVLPDDDDEEMVLTSIHQAKGLEWRFVFLIWAADGKFPSARSLKETDMIEEERRLFYVAVTRAKDEFHAVYPLIESDYSRMSVVQRPSRFVTEVAEDLFELWQVEG